jgi:hypothetical protein
MHRLALSSLLLSLTLVACGPTGTWSRSGATTDAHVYMAPAPQAVAKAIDWWITREYGVSPTTVDISLVPSLDPAATKILELIPTARLVPMSDPNGIRVEALRLSYEHASIDLSAPRKDLPRQLITIDMDGYGGQAWKVSGANWWRFNQKQITQVHKDLERQQSDLDSQQVELEQQALDAPETDGDS